jgi:hypothetical protein
MYYGHSMTLGELILDQHLNSFILLRFHHLNLAFLILRLLPPFSFTSVSHFSSSHANTTEWPPRPEEFFLINSETSELR